MWMLIVAMITIYGLTFAFPTGSITIDYPIAAQSFLYDGTKVLFIDVYYPLNLSVLGFSVANGSATLTYLSSTSIALSVNGTNPVVQIIGFPPPQQVLANGSPTQFSYDPLTQTLTIYAPSGASNLSIVYSTGTTSSGGSTYVTVTLTLSTVTKRYFDRLSQAAIDTVIVIGLVLIPVVSASRWGLGKRTLLVATITFIAATACLAIRAVIPNYVIITNGVQKIVYTKNPVGYVYIAPLAISLAIATLSVLRIMFRHI